jgi:hypothetical protein
VAWTGGGSRLLESHNMRCRTLRGLRSCRTPGPEPGPTGTRRTAASSSTQKLPSFVTWPSACPRETVCGRSAPTSMSTAYGPVALATVTGNVDISTSAGRLMARTLGAFGAHESEVKSERIRRKHLEVAEHGKVSGGLSRYLYRRASANVPMLPGARGSRQDSLRT